MADTPYQPIATQLANDKVVPFLGSAASFVGVASGPTRLPDGQGLADELVDAFANYPGNRGDPLTKVSQFYEECILGRSPLYDHLRKRLHEEQVAAPLSPTASFLAELPGLNLVIVTTNYDSQVERAFERKGRPYVVVTHNTNRNSKNY